MSPGLKNSSIRIASVLVALLLAAPCACGHRRADVPATTSPLRVMSFNIRLDSGVDGDNGWSFRKTGVQGMLPFHHVDLAGFQEVLPNQRADLVAALPEFASVGEGRDATRGGEACPIFYLRERFDLVEHETFWLSPTPETPGDKGWDAKFPRIATWARLRDRRGGATFYVLNTHLDSVGPLAREEGAKLILRRIEGKRPLIVTGDFNTRPDSPPYLVMTSGGLHDARKVSRRSPYPFPDTGTSTGFAAPPRARGTIDYVFVSPPVEVLAFGVITENWDALFPSDHRPIVADLRLP